MNVHISNHTAEDFITGRYTVTVQDQSVSIPAESLDAVLTVLDLVGAEVTKRISPSVLDTYYNYPTSGVAPRK